MWDNMKKITILLMILICILTLTGCWNLREISEMGVAVAIGVDLVEDELMELTVQVLIPRRLAQEGYEGNAVVTYSTTGRTTFELFRKITTISSRKIYIGHIQLVVLGEEFAKKGILDTIDFFERDHEFRRQAHILLTKGVSAKAILETGSVIELIPAEHITKAIDNAIHTGTTKKITLIELFKDLNSKGNQVLLPTVFVRHEGIPDVAKDLRIAGTGVFDKDMLIGFLDEFETRGYLWVAGDLHGGILVIPSPKDPLEFISLELMKVNSKMSVSLVDNKPILQIKIKADSNLGEQQKSIDLTTPEMIKYVEEESKKLIKEEILKALYKGQRVHSLDFFGFGEIVAKEHPKYWKEVEDDWDTVFSNAEINIDIESNIRRTGQILQPSTPE
ncbi:Ger(x)C family spore germination protein [Alkaliphilus peptidifermentans]|uniref:Spore germination protein KC n=1 Tax=Alkaliphilus peptidifermentans DSM 18978 TaxID=1120976 RepID=A0A1G5EYJ3_9FIRM|nr:Ger(x)C family spore germination protein [Alkaliphilus peptidifermentans]SCY32075.1 spore germination protein KC [Alkaliphilus peptidifermentans DSM 18978]